MVRFFSSSPARVARLYMGWFGKLPAVGDFAGRGIPGTARETVHEWIASGMADLVREDPEDWRAAYLVSPVWHFVVNAGIWDQYALAGCIAPSIDKVGRFSPLLALRAFEDDIDDILPPRSRWLYQIDAGLRRIIGERIAVEDVPGVLGLTDAELEDGAAPEAVGGILSELGISDEAADTHREWFSWPDLSALFRERNNRSFWWAEPSPHLPPRQIIHRGPPDDVLFCLLMGGGWLND
ncbi:MAG: type VI secretion system-associated protein TagF [Azoarcus sp.]|jgi:type VI secretion system protein ImpM|nr:type VI secretion system-associated protein TagF [Azoarcus sp.]